MLPFLHQPSCNNQELGGDHDYDLIIIKLIIIMWLELLHTIPCTLL